MRLKPVLAAAILFVATATGAAAQNVRIGLQDDPDTLDPAKNWTFVGRHVLASLCDKLVELAPDGTIVPQLATAWTTADRVKPRISDQVICHVIDPATARAWPIASSARIVSLRGRDRARLGQPEAFP